MRLKMLLLFLAVCLAAACCQAVAPTPTPTSTRGAPQGGIVTVATATPVPPLPRSFKGYELYSWPEEGTWHFTLITGTNRNKTVEEVKATDDQLSADGWVRIHVQGVEAIKAVLSRVPAGEWVFWAGADWASGTLGGGSDITMPPQEIIDAVEQHAEQLGLQFHAGR